MKKVYEMITDVSFRVSPKIAAVPSLLKKRVATDCGIKENDINDLKIIKRSIDARQRNVAINLTVRIATGDDLKVKAQYEPVVFKKVAGGCSADCDSRSRSGRIVRSIKGN